jgi:hypothetical protein
MNFKQQLLMSTVIIMSISACGGGGGGDDAPSGNTATAPTVDGAKQVLTENEDSFIPTASNNNSLKNITAPSTLTYRASTTLQLQVDSNSAQPCNINIYKEYDTLSDSGFTPDPSSQVMQIDSETCSYSGPIYILNQQKTLLAEVVSLQHATTSYHEVLITNNTITLSVN